MKFYCFIMVYIMFCFSSPGMFVEINFERLFADFTAPIIWIIAIV